MQQPPPQWGSPSPQQPYPHQGQPMSPPPAMPPRPPAKPPWYRSPLGIWCLVALLLVCGVFGIIGATAHSTVPSSSPDTSTITATEATSNAAPTHALTWKTTHTFTGNGSKKTGTFTVGDDWRIAWKCNPSSFGGMDYNLIVVVYHADGSLADTGINTMCQHGNASDMSEIHTAGQVYLDVNSEGQWTLAVQELH